MKNSISRIKRLFIKIGRFDEEVISRVPSNVVNKMSVLGGALLIPVIVATFSFGFAGTYIFDEVWQAILFGCVVGFLVLLAEQALANIGEPGKFDLPMAARIISIVVASFLFGEFLVLEWFDSEIEEILYKDLKIEIDSIDLVYDAHLADQDLKLSLAQSRVDDKWKILQDEIDGRAASGIRGLGPVGIEKQKQFNIETNAFKVAKEQIDLEKHVIQVSRESDIKNLTEATGTGLLSRIRALHSIKDPAVIWVSWGLRLFLVFFELTPVLLKMSRYSRSVYHDIAAMENNLAQEAELENSSFRMEILRMRADTIAVKEREEEKLRQLKLVLSGQKERSSFLINEMKSSVEDKLKLISEMENSNMSTSDKDEILRKLN